MKRMSRFLFIIVLSMFCSNFVAEGQQAVSRYYGGDLCAYAGFKCLKIKSSDTWEKLFPDVTQREIVKRLNRMNLPINYRRWIVVPTNLESVHYMDLSPFPQHMDTNGEKMVIVNLGVQAFGAYDQDGNLVHWGPISGGKGWCSDINGRCETVNGSFRLVRKDGEKCISDRFPVETAGGAPMPYCMFFYKGFALHASVLPGYNASHGCVRLFLQDAQWLNQQFVDIGTRIVVSN